MRLIVRRPVVLALFIVLALLASRTEADVQPRLGALQITAPLYAGAATVEVWHVYPNAHVVIYADGNPIGSADYCWYSECWVGVKPISQGQTLTATQTVSGMTSESRQEDAVQVQPVPKEARDPAGNWEKLLPPKIDVPLEECQQTVAVANVVPGAVVEVYSPPALSNLIGQTGTPWNAAFVPTKVLARSAGVSARQTLGNIQPSDLSAPLTVAPRPATLPPPVLDGGDVVAGSRSITLHDLHIGATVEIYYESGGAHQVIGGGIAPYAHTIFPVEPLSAGWASCNPPCIKADQSLCDIHTTSQGVAVRSKPDTPTIQAPLCSGSYKLMVCGTVPGVLKIVLNGDAGNPIVAGAESGCTQVILPDKQYLQAGDALAAIQASGATESDPSPVVKVDDPAGQLTAQIAGGQTCPGCAGQPSAPVFRLSDFSDAFGPQFKAAQCGIDGVEVSIMGVHGQTGNPANGYKFKLKPVPGEKGHFEGTWDWPAWPSNEKDAKQLIGLDTANFTVLGTGKSAASQFYVTKQGCRDLQGLCAHDQYTTFYQACVDRVNQLRVGEQLPPYARANADLERCADRDAWVNAETEPHNSQCSLGSLSAQNDATSGGYASIAEMLDVGIQTLMWQNEKKCYEANLKAHPGDTAGSQCYHDPACQCGHYVNLTDKGGGNTKSLACGLYQLPSGDLTFVQDFYR